MSTPAWRRPAATPSTGRRARTIFDDEDVSGETAPPPFEGEPIAAAAAILNATPEQLRVLAVVLRPLAQ